MVNKTPFVLLVIGCLLGGCISSPSSQTISGVSIEQQQQLLKEIRSSANQGNAEAQYKLGGAYLLGRGGLTQDYQLAVLWLRKAAEQGNIEAQSLLGNMYSTGRGVQRDYREAATWIRKAAEQGRADSQNLLALMYFGGIGVHQSDQDAMDWFSKAATQGHADAQFNLGTVHAEAESHRIAVEWFQKAANQGHTLGQYRLGRSYLAGIGVSRDYQYAEEWLRKAAEKGNASALFDLGLMYGLDRHKPRNIVLAYMLIELAILNGNQNASHYRDRFSKQMTQQQLEEAKALSSNWRTGNPLPTETMSQDKVID